MKISQRNRPLVISVYSAFSYGSNIIWGILDLLPQFIRRPVFRLMFKQFGRGCMLDYRSFVRYPWRVSIGNNVVINRGCQLYPSLQTDQGILTLEDQVVLSPGVVIFCATHDYSSFSLPDTSSPVTIGRDAWIGGNAIILPGVTIGEGAIIGAGSIVTRNIPPFTVAVGNPAKVVKARGMAQTHQHKNVLNA